MEKIPPKHQEVYKEWRKSQQTAAAVVMSKIVMFFQHLGLIDITSCSQHKQIAWKFLWKHPNTTSSRRYPFGTHLNTIAAFTPTQMIYSKGVKTNSTAFQSKL